MNMRIYRRILSLLLAVCLLTAGTGALAAETDMGGTPTIIEEFESEKFVTAGDTLTLSLNAQGEGLQFQWYCNDLLLMDQDGARLEIPNAAAGDSGVYYCTVTYPGGAYTTGNCRVTVQARPELTQDISAASLTLNAGDTITLSAAAAGDGVEAQWFCILSDGSGNALEGQTGTTLSLKAEEAHNGSEIYCRFWNNAGEVYTSRCKITVNSTKPPVITKDPVGETVMEGESAIFIARADGVKEYVWRFINRSGDAYDYKNITSQFPGLRVSGGNTDTLALSAIPKELDGWSVACLFKGTGGESLSKSAGITVLPAVAAISIVTQPKAATLSVDDAQGFSLSVQAKANNGGELSYQWYSAATNSTAAMTAIPGATGSTYHPAGDKEGTTYYRVGITLRRNGVDSQPLFSYTVPVTFTPSVRHVHAYSQVWEHNDLSHWHQCTCGDHADEAMHTYTWTVIAAPTSTTDGQQKGVCTVCGYETLQPIPAGSMTEATPEAEQQEESRGGGHAILYILLGAAAAGVIGGAAYAIVRVLKKDDEEEYYDDYEDEDEEGEEPTQTWDPGDEDK